MDSPQGEKATLLRAKLVFFPPLLPPLQKVNVDMLPLFDKVGLAFQIRPNLPVITIGFCVGAVVPSILVSKTKSWVSNGLFWEKPQKGGGTSTSARPTAVQCNALKPI